MLELLAPDTGSETVWDKLLGRPLMIAGIVVVALLARWLVHRAIRKVTTMMEQRSAERYATGGGSSVAAARQALSADPPRPRWP